MKVVRVILLAFTLVLAIGIFAACGSGGGDGEYSTDNPLKLRLASDAPDEHIATGLNNDLCKMIEEKTEGRVTMQYFPGSQLGSYETVFEEVVKGTIDAAQITVPDALDKKLGAAYLPYYATSFDQAKELYGPESVMFKTFAELTAKNDVQFLGFVLEGFIGMATVKEPKNVFEPGAKKGIKIRVPAMDTFRIAQEDLGYNVQTITYAEVPTAIQTKVVDGWIGGTPNINYAWVGDTIKQMYVNYIHAEATSYVLSDATLAKMTPEDQEIVKQCFLDQ
ncbi:MAG: TRAP transporter substrate-binding protein DctP, partial [Anaerovoracaceae bacterium]